MNDPLLLPYLPVIQGRHQHFIDVLHRVQGDASRLADACNSHLYYGLHRTHTEWVLREWAPNATAIFLLCDSNDWQKNNHFSFTKINDQDWELRLPANILRHEMLYKLLVEWEGGSGERLPSHTTRAVQDDYTKVFSAQVWCPEHPYQWQHPRPKAAPHPLIYEAHIGMSTEHQRVSTFIEFRLYVLPRIAALGYNTLQLMAIQEHPYYGSFGYQVANFFAVSSRFGTPEELKELIDAAHGLGIRVLLDIVHSHSVSNEAEGLSCFDGTDYLYFHRGERGKHPAWDSRCFDYGKPQVLNFLLSNCKYWLEEYHFDGFRFDGVTSMMYLNHGLEKDFVAYSDYFDSNRDEDAICYLTLANSLIHEVKPDAITIAEDMSGMPGLAAPYAEGGIGFDYRMAMGIPDFFIKYIKEVPDEYWKVGHIFWHLTDHRAEERTISYVESHDQALVGDKTMIFRLVDSDMYWHFERRSRNLNVSRGIALLKMIKLMTATTICGGYLNFMGNEFGHPEWVDFPRQGNGWSYKYARRQWELVDNEQYLYSDLNRFDRDMIHLVSGVGGFERLPINKIWDKEFDQVLAYSRGDMLFVFNFNPCRSFTDYGIPVDKGSYRIVLNTDNTAYGGFGLVDETLTYTTQPTDDSHRQQLRLYIPSRSAFVLKKIDKPE